MSETAVLESETTSTNASPEGWFPDPPQLSQPEHMTSPTTTDANEFFEQARYTKKVQEITTAVLDQAQIDLEAELETKFGKNAQSQKNAESGLYATGRLRFHNLEHSAFVANAAQNFLERVNSYYKRTRNTPLFSALYLQTFELAVREHDIEQQYEIKGEGLTASRVMAGKVNEELSAQKAVARLEKIINKVTENCQKANIPENAYKWAVKELRMVQARTPEMIIATFPLIDFALLKAIPPKLIVRSNMLPENASIEMLATASADLRERCGRRPPTEYCPNSFAFYFECNPSIDQVATEIEEANKGNPTEVLTHYPQFAETLYSTAQKFAETQASFVAGQREQLNETIDANPQLLQISPDGELQQELKASYTQFEANIQASAQFYALFVKHFADLGTPGTPQYIKRVGAMLVSLGRTIDPTFVEESLVIRIADLDIAVPAAREVVSTIA